MSEPKRKAGWSFILLPIIAMLAVWLIAPAISTTENATVFLGECFEPECALKGDITVNFFTRDYELTQDDRSVVVFQPETVNMMSWPAPKE
jgi:hypothetical protein